MSFKLALKHSFIQNLSSLLHFISKLASLLINPEDWQEGGGRSLNHNCMCCSENSMVFGFADKFNYNRQLTTVGMWVATHYFRT